MSTLLEKAKSIPVSQPRSTQPLNTDELALFVALTKNEVSREQAAKAMEITISQLDARRHTCVLQAIKVGALTFA